jgi:hypothetical protein
MDITPHAQERTRDLRRDRPTDLTAQSTTLQAFLRLKNSIARYRSWNVRCGGAARPSPWRWWPPWSTPPSPAGTSLVAARSTSIVGPAATILMCVQSANRRRHSAISAAIPKQARSSMPPTAVGELRSAGTGAHSCHTLPTRERDLRDVLWIEKTRMATMNRAIGVGLTQSSKDTIKGHGANAQR